MKIDINCQKNTDVLIIGAGMAGMSAAIESDAAGADVILTTSARLCSGSSFYPGTWGLGMVAPVGEFDKKNFVETIGEVGCRMNDPKLSQVLIDRIGDDILGLEKMGVTFKKPENPQQDDTLIPCFDKKQRKWYGYLFETARPAFTERIRSSGIEVLEETEILRIEPFEKGYRALGVKKDGRVISLAAKSLVIATGGVGGLYQHRLNTSDIKGTGQALAYQLGCELVNVEFMQFIPGFVQPSYRTIVNERAFKLADLLDCKGRKIINDQKLLEERSGHGPFSTRLDTKMVDIALFEEFLKTGSDQCVRMRYRIKDMSKEGLMIRDYFKWLKETKHVEADEEIFILPFMHAANGGIRINEKAATSVPGIFAAGEATGGVHGADRIGGLSTANALVFGKIAGREAAKHARGFEMQLPEASSVDLGNLSGAEKYEETMKEIRRVMYRYGSIIRTGDGLEEALKSIEKIEGLADLNHEVDLARSFTMKNSILMAKVLLNSMLLRQESRGAHYRKDYPDQSTHYDRTLIMYKDKKGNLGYRWERA